MAKQLMIPTNISKKDSKTLQIDWDDGHRSLHPLLFLRRACPCASCREARSKPAATGLRILSTAEAIPAELHVVQAEVVGRYAISFQWSDGHNTGIYSFQLLRELCQCDACEAQRKSSPAPEP